MIIKLIMLRFYFLIPIVLLVLSCLVAQEKPSPLDGIDLRIINMHYDWANLARYCLLYTSPSPRDMRRSRMPSSA